VRRGRARHLEAARPRAPAGGEVPAARPSARVPRVRDARPPPARPARGAQGLRRGAALGRPGIRPRGEDRGGRRRRRRRGRGLDLPAPGVEKARSDRKFREGREAGPQVFRRSVISFIRTCPRPHPSGPCRPRAPGGA
jgi:hypothetical protein